MNIKTYIMHCKSLIARKKFMIAQLEKYKFSNYEFYENYDAIELTKDDIKYHYNENLIEQYNKYKMWFPYQPAKSLGIAEISLTIKYVKLYEKIANGTDDFVLILEDDSIFSDNFTDQFNELIFNTPKSFDMIFVSSGCNLHAKNITADNRIYKKEHPATRCTGATVVTKKACKELYKTMIPFHLCIDWELNYQLYIHNHEVYWWEPPIIDQGSESGLFKTTLR